MRKKLNEIKSLELNITMSTRMHKVDFLDVTFNLANNTLSLSGKKRILHHTYTMN